MLEIFALPYFAVSGVIGWAIFEPFIRLNDSEPLSPSKLTTTDLLAIPLPASVLFAAARLTMPASFVSIIMQLLVIVVALLFAVTALTTGLLIMPKTITVPFPKRMSVVGLIAPFGILITIGWVGFLIWACSYSMLYLVPSSIAVAAAIAGLRVLGFWVCQTEPEVVESAANPPA
ncbi:MAG: hypothetical protein AAGG48_21320 [Planctomycetota bacterium]